MTIELSPTLCMGNKLWKKIDFKAIFGFQKILKENAKEKK